SKEDRIEFSRDFVLKTLPYVPMVYSFIYDFFHNLQDINVILTKKNKEDKFLATLVYSLNNNDTFFIGYPPANQDTIDQVNFEFNNLLPEDFLTFSKIHSGFKKNEDSGIFPLEMLKTAYDEFQIIASSKQASIRVANSFIDSKSLIPFYQSYSKDNFQCFFSQWFPKGNIGNVYYDGSDNTISDYQNFMLQHEDLAFESFLDWLIFYLDILDIDNV
ncbi:MAG: hypothetical protein JXA94_04190, partial [Parachlamydiales bacterium]|nr:hypothetical protein [Parachlamydiales bacterium]